MIAPGQHRLVRLQLVNWGTFHGYFDLPVPRSGLLVTGPSGSGKSSLLDALASVLVQPRWLQFNAAAQEGGVADRSRTLVSYVRGAYKREADGTTGEVSTTFLRPGATWSAVALTFDDAAGRVTTVLRLFHLPRGTTAAGDLASVFCLAEEPVDLLALEPFAKDGLDQRRLKAAHPGWSVQTTYSAFSPRLQRRLGLASDQAQRLLHKTQSAKNLTSLDTLLREFMLDQPDTFDLVTSATEQFHELAAAHASVVDARRQKEALAPLRPLDGERAHWLAERDALAGEQRHLETVRLARQLEATAAELAQLETRLERLAAEVSAADAAEHARRDDRDAAWRLVEGRGGRELEALEREAAALRATVAQRAQVRRQVQATADAVGLALPPGEAGWVAFVAEAEAAAAALAEDEDAREARHRLSGEHADARDRVRRIEGELQALRLQRSGLEQPLVSLRDALVAATGAPSERLPFAGELIEVRPDEAAWTGPIERILRSLARTLLVPDDLYPHVSSLVDERSLGLRLLYARVPARVDEVPERADPRSLVHKVTVAASEHGAWLAAELARRFDYACVDSVAALRGVTRGVTRAGQVRHSEVRHEKDDRTAVDDRRHWVLGSSRTARQEALLAALAEAQGAEAAARAARDAAEAAR
nr:ATPase [Propionibacterium sp.]